MTNASKRRGRCGIFQRCCRDLTYRGVTHCFLSQYEQSVAAEREALKIASETRNAFYIALARTYLGFGLANQGRISEALSCLDEAVALARRSENGIALARASNGIGRIYREMLDPAANRTRRNRSRNCSGREGD